MLNLSPTHLVMVAISVGLVMISAVLHEVAHGWVAYRLGDPTAKNAGRLTLNPAKHLDPVGSVILPLVMALVGGPIFAFAKPVPYNPNNLRHQRTDEVLVALAGPACNLLQALAGALVCRLLFGPIMETTASGTYLLTDSDAVYWAYQILSSYVYVNLMLMFFNLIPLPPLDGSHVVQLFLKGNARMSYYKIQAYSMPILLIVLYLIPMITPWDPLNWYLDVTAGNLSYALLGIA